MKKIILLLLVAATSCSNNGDKYLIITSKHPARFRDIYPNSCTYEYKDGWFLFYEFDDSCNKYEVGDTIKFNVKK
jgi:hypothetical protein